MPLTVTPLPRSLKDPYGRDIVPDATHMVRYERDGRYVAQPVDADLAWMIENSPEMQARYEEYMERVLPPASDG